MSDNDIGCDGMVSIAHMLTENYFITELSMYFFNRNDFVFFPLELFRSRFIDYI